MLKILLKLFLISFYFGISCSDQSVSVKKSNIQEIPDPFEQNKLLAKTINFGNALEAPKEGEWGITLKEHYFKKVKETGFTAVRVPVRWSAHTQIDSPFTILPDFFSRIDWVLNMAEENDLAVIINIHHFEEIFSNPEQEKGKFISIWRQIAERYLEKPTTVFYEILNEPHDQLTAELWNDYLAVAISAIRAIDSTHTLIIGTAEWGGIDAMEKLIIPEEEQNAILTFHYYGPFHFTHQGAEWVEGSDAWLGTAWSGSQNEKVSISSEFLYIKLWAEQRNRPVFLGEFGAYNKADLESRIRWTQFIARKAEQDSFSWAYWEFAAGFGIYDPVNDQWREPLLKALLP